MAGSGAGRAGRLEDLYRIVRQAVETRRPIAAVYHNRRRLLCPHRLGRNKEGQLRVLCYQYGGESESGLKPAGSPANWRCIALDQLSALKLLNGPVANESPGLALPPLQEEWRRFWKPLPVLPTHKL